MPTPTPDSIYLGIDLGTGGVRAVAVTGDGEVLAEQSFAYENQAGNENEGQHEQDAQHWWSATQCVLRDLVAELNDKGYASAAIAALAVDGTSGTIVPVDRNCHALRPALMYNDARAAAEASELTVQAQQTGSDVAIASSYAIARIRWMQRHEPEIFERTHCFAHHADFIAWHLLKPQASPLKSPATDYSNALKTGYDLASERWPDWFSAIDGIVTRLPDVVAPGTVVGNIDREIAAALGLPAHIKIVTGCSDGTAGFLASGAKNLGDDNTTLGTTLVFKRIADKPINNELVYSHKLPGGRWLPGAASNTGGEWIRQQFPDADLATLDAQAKVLLPTNVLAYPLARTGERFPFRSSDATGFIDSRIGDEPSRIEGGDVALPYAAMLQGTALFERLCYEQLDRETGIDSSKTGDIYATGGGAKSDVWLQLRADVTGRTIHVPAYPESAFGAAVLAAAGATGVELWQTIGRMVRIERTFTPSPNRAAFDDVFVRFKDELRQRGWVSDC